jgi:hypothetical protein
MTAEPILVSELRELLLAYGATLTDEQTAVYAATALAEWVRESSDNADRRALMLLVHLGKELAP